MLIDLRSAGIALHWVWYVLVLSLLFLVVLVAARAFYPVKYRDAVDKYSAEFGLDPSLLYAVIRVESGFRAGARSAVGASGLMQIMPRTGSWAASQLGIRYSDDCLLDPETNIRIGAFYLRHLLDQFDGDLTTALAAYNGGLRNVREWIQMGGKWPLVPGDIRFAETRKFIKKVSRDIKVYRLLYPRYLALRLAIQGCCWKSPGST